MPSATGPAGSSTRWRPPPPPALPRYVAPIAACCPPLPPPSALAACLARALPPAASQHLRVPAVWQGRLTAHESVASHTLGGLAGAAADAVGLNGGAAPGNAAGGGSKAGKRGAKAAAKGGKAAAAKGAKGSGSTTAGSNAGDAGALQQLPVLLLIDTAGCGMEEQQEQVVLSWRMLCMLGPCVATQADARHQPMCRGGEPLDATHAPLLPHCPAGGRQPGQRGGGADGHGACAAPGGCGGGAPRHWSHHSLQRTGGWPRMLACCCVLGVGGGARQWAGDQHLARGAGGGVVGGDRVASVRRAALRTVASPVASPVSLLCRSRCCGRCGPPTTGQAWKSALW